MKYKRLGRSRRGLGKWHTLWLGDDHLLGVESTGYSEEYTRYYLKDIQAIISRRTAWGNILTVIFGLVVAISLVSAYVGYSNGLTPVSITAGIFGSIFVPFLLWNLFCGPTCRCHVRVPLGIQELPALDRIRSVKKVLARLRPQIRDLQGEISREEIIKLVAAPQAASPAAQFTTLSSLDTSPMSGEAASSYRGGIHRAAFLILIADGGLCSLQIFQSSKALTIFVTALGIVFLMLAVIALIKQRDHRISPLARKMTWGGLATLWAGAMIGYFFVVFLNLDKLKRGVSIQNEILDLYLAIEPAAHPSYAFFLIVYAVVSAVIGITGLIALGRKQAVAGKRQP